MAPGFTYASRNLGRFVKGRIAPLEECRTIEFKEIVPTKKSPIDAILDKLEEYVVAFLNVEGGSIFFGIDNDRVLKGVTLSSAAKDDLRTQVPDKLRDIQPSWAWFPGTEKIRFHSLYESDTAGNALPDEYVAEVAVPSAGARHVYLTRSGKCWMRTDGSNHALNGAQLLSLIYERHLSKKLDTGSSTATDYWGFAPVMRRIQLVHSVLQGANVLWVDDQPDGNFYERLAFSELGVQIELALSTDELVGFLKKKQYHAIISDMARGGIDNEGVQMLGTLPAGSPPVVFYTLRLDKSLGTPAGAFGITNRPDELMHLLLDMLERTRLGV
jgi:hypothetical protein